MLLLWMVCFAFVDIGTKKGVLTVTDAPKGPTKHKWSEASSAYMIVLHFKQPLKLYPS